MFHLITTSQAKIETRTGRGDVPIKGNGKDVLSVALAAMLAVFLTDKKKKRNSVIPVE